MTSLAVFPPAHAPAWCRRCYRRRRLPIVFYMKSFLLMLSGFLSLFVKMSHFLDGPTPCCVLIFWVALLTITAIGNIFWVLLQLPTFLRYYYREQKETVEETKTIRNYSTIGWNPLSVLHPYFLANTYFSFCMSSCLYPQNQDIWPKINILKETPLYFVITTISNFV